MPDFVDTTTPYSPGWYLRILAEQLHNRRNGRDGRRRWSRTGMASTRIRPPLTLLDDYWRGDPPLQEDIHRGWAEPFRQYYRMGRLHVADLLVSATGNRMGIRDFRTAAADDEQGDERARGLMRANNLKLVARDVHDTFLGLGDGYTLVTPPDAFRDYSLITAESPLQTITAHDPATGRTLAGLKMFRDDWDTADLAYLFLPGDATTGATLWVASLPGPSMLGGRGRFSFSAAWQWEPDLFDDIPGKRVPIVRFRNRRGVGEFEHHLDTLDRINDKLFNEWWISKLQAFRQRAIMLEDEDLDDDLVDDGPEEPTAVDAALEDAYGSLFDRVARGELDGIFTSSPDALWQLPAHAKMWESSAVDVRPLIESVASDLKHLAAVTSNPLHTVAPDAASGSAEGASLLREEHVYKVEDRRDRAAGSWAETISLAFEYEGDMERADVREIEVVWGPVERYSIGERSQAAAALQGVLPSEAIFTDYLQYEPADVVNRLRALRGRDLLYTTPAGA